MNYNKKLLKYLSDDSFIIPRSIEEYEKELDEEVNYWINTNLSKERIAEEIRGSVYPSLWAGDLMRIINDLAWIILNERKEHKRIVKEFKRELKCISFNKINYEYDFEENDYFKDKEL